MVLRQRAVERILESRVGQRVLVGKSDLQLLLEYAERHRIGPRRRKREIDQLKHRLEILTRRAARQSFLGIADIGSHRHAPAGENPAEVEASQLAEAALRNHLVGGFRRDKVPIARQGCAARADGTEQNLVLFERRRLQHDTNAIGEPPLGDAQLVVG